MEDEEADIESDEDMYQLNMQNNKEYTGAQGDQIMWRINVSISVKQRRGMS